MDSNDLGISLKTCAVLAAGGSSGMGIMPEPVDCILLALAQFTIIPGVAGVGSRGQAGVTNVPVAAVSRVK